MDGKRLIQTIRLRNLLSFGPETEEFELQPLNVLIGPNASGKSNLIEAISLLQAAPRDLTVPIGEGGGVREWLWKGGEARPVAELRVLVDYSHDPVAPTLAYELSFTSEGMRLAITGEQVHGIDAIDLAFDALKPHESVLSQLRGPDQDADVTYLARLFDQMKLYRDWDLGRTAALRTPQPGELPQDFLSEDAHNLALVINDLVNRPQMRAKLLDYLKRFYSPVTDITTLVYGNSLLVFLHEEGLNAPVPASRLSDGTLRYLCLLAVLLHPDPPPLICIEEPELGLHPDILPTIAELLIGTKLSRLDPEKLAKWLEKYTLDQLWSMGELGGNRW